MRSSLRALAVACLSLFACKADFQSGVTRCATDLTCPPGFTCANGLCYTNGRAPVDTTGRGGAGGAGGGGGTSGSGGGAGQSDAGKGGAGGTSMDTAAPDRTPATPADCARFAAAWCAKKSECEPLDDPFANDGDCRAGLESYCKAYFVDQPDSTWTPATAGVCVAEIEQPGCFSWFGLDSSRACDPRGKRPGGSGAYSWVQCESAAAYWRGGSCGYCFAAAAAGQACDNDAVCPVGHLCSSAGNCRPASLNGQPCGNDSPCHRGLTCVSGVCKPRALAGAVCRVDNDCDGTLGLRCHKGVLRCAKSKPGMSWNGGNPDGSIDTCARGTVALDNGSCQTYAGPDQACSRDAGPDCRLGLECVAGKCVTPKVVDCPAVRPGEGYPAGADPWCYAERPLYCPAAGELDWNCWPAGTACNTVSRCGDQLTSCTAANQVYDCTMKTCIPSPCAKPEFPRYCSARDDVPGSCWQKDTRCSTITRCGDKGISCDADRAVPDCALEKCVPACAVPAGASPCNKCAAEKCCASYASCGSDPMCTSKTGANWQSLQACATKFCAACATDPLVPPK